MRAVDPSITILASGAMPDEMTVTGNARMATGRVIGEVGTDADWTGGLFSKCWGTFDGVTGREQLRGHDIGSLVERCHPSGDDIKRGVPVPALVREPLAQEIL